MTTGNGENGEDGVVVLEFALTPPPRGHRPLTDEEHKQTKHPTPRDVEIRNVEP